MKVSETMSGSTNRSSTFGQAHAFGGFESSPSQSSPFCSLFQQQQTQPAFGSNLFGSSTPLYSTSQPAFGATSSSAFGSTSTPALGAMSSSAFGSTLTPDFGSTTTPAFGVSSAPAFAVSSALPFPVSSAPPFAVSTTPSFPVSSAPPFAVSSAPPFPVSSAPPFAVSTTPPFPVSSAPPFAVSSAPPFGSGGAFGASSTPSFSASSTPAFSASNTTALGSSPAPTFGSSSTTSPFSFGSPIPAFGGSPFGSTPSPFGAQSSPFGSQATKPAIGSTGFRQSTFGGQCGGSRAAAYSPTAEVDFLTGKQLAGKLESLSAMPVYKDKSHEELRWEDYQLRDKGGPNRVQFANMASFGAPAEAAQSNPFGTTATFGKSSTNHVSFNTASNPFFQNRQTFGSSTASGFGSSPLGASSTTNPFGANSSPSASLFGAPSSNSAFWVPLNICAYGLDSLLLIAFGQSASSPFGFQSVFGQTSASNPFVPKPFGSTNPFGSQTGGSIFGGTSTGVFGATQSFSPLASTPIFCAASTTPAFGSSLPVFGSTPNSFGGSSTFGQNPSFGGFGSTPSQSSPFGSLFQQQQTQPAFGSNLFGSSTPFYATTQPVFGSSISSPAFGSTRNPAFGATSTPAFGSTGSAFVVSSAPAFGSGGAFGASSTPGFGVSSTPAFGASNTTAFGSSPAPTFGSSSTTPFSFGAQTPASGLSASSFGGSPFGSTPSPFGAQSSPFGSQATTPAIGSTGFGQSTFGGQRGGSRAAAYSPTAEVDYGNLESISAMPVYKDKSHEELRWEDYQLGDKGGPNRVQFANAASFGAPAGAVQSTASGTTATFGQASTNPFSSNTASNPIFQNRQPLGHQPPLAFSSSPFSASFGASPSTSLFGAPSSNSVLWIPLNICAYGLDSLLLIGRMRMNS